MGKLNFGLLLFSVAVLTLLNFTSAKSTDSEEAVSDIVSYYWDSDEQAYVFADGVVDNWIAWANFTNKISTTGWSFLEVVTNEEYGDDDQAYAAGYVEGLVTCDLIYNTWYNNIDKQCDDDPEFCDRLLDYLNANKKWMNQQVKKHAATDPYWHQVQLILTQISGLHDGCGTQFLEDDRHAVLKEFTYLYFSIQDDVSDLQEAIGKPTDPKDRMPGSCSALIKWLPEADEEGNADLLISHVTWASFDNMIRILKKYRFNYHLTDELDSPLIPGSNMTFSSYAGAFHSIDDYYLISSGLVAMETTIENLNEDLWKAVRPQSLLEGFRSMLANRLATSGQMWTELFARNNSGTYNNQWMIVDFKKFQPESNMLKDGLFWILEQLPGFTESQDMTDTLRKQSYWPSYNSPYFPSVFNMSGTPEMVKKYGADLYSYEDQARGRIFRRDHHKVVDIESMIRLMRSNDYLNDPFSICNCTPVHNAGNALSSRLDLNPANGTYPVESLEHMAYGATDMKITNYDMYQNLQFIAQSGPTFDSVPPFQWSTYDDRDYYSYLGMPDRWEFQQLLTEWD